MIAVVNDENNQIHIIDETSELEDKTIHIIKLHQKSIFSLKFNSVYNLFLSLDKSAQIEIWETCTFLFPKKSRDYHLNFTSKLDTQLYQLVK